MCIVDQMTQMLSDDVGPVMKLDAKYSSHPIVQPVNHPDEITEIFDTISYSKVNALVFNILLKIDVISWILGGISPDDAGSFHG